MLTANTQEQLALDYSASVESAFADGRLYLIIDNETRHNPHLSFVDCPPKWDGVGTLVHVISRPAGGEIRGYVLIGGRLHMRLPNYAGDWPEMDAAVKRLVASLLNARAKEQR